jgi:hypothetical protein
MICLLVDESYAFDYLSILEMKSNLDPENSAKKENFRKCHDFLKSQLNAVFNSIIHSTEYHNCYKANLETFNAVDEAKTDKVKASFVDKCNYGRHIAKQKLQKKFFDNELNEIKIGYEIYEGEKNGPCTSI